MNRPTETLTASVSTLVAAVLTILSAFYPGVAAKITAEVSAAIVLLLAWTATVVTYFVTKQIRAEDSPLVSRKDGSVGVE